MTWTITILVMRLLSPADYGLMASAMLLIGFSVLLNELGLIPALIQVKTADEYRIRQVFGAMLLSNAALFLILMTIAPFFADFFAQDRLVPIVRVLAVQLMVGALSSVPEALLRRDLRFKEISIIEFCAMVVSSVGTLILAYAGSGVWALVFGGLALAVVKTLGILAVTRFRTLPVFRFSGMGGMVSFGANVTAQRILWYFGFQADIALIGKFLGQELLGLYSVANHLAMMPMHKLMGILNQVAFPAYARLQDDIERSKGYFYTAIEVVCLVTFPLLWGLSSVAEEFLSVILGDKWVATAPVLMIVALTVPLRMVDMLLSPLTDGLGRPDVSLRNVITFTIFVPGAIFVGLQWGLVGAAAGGAIAYLPTVALNCRRSLRLLDSGVGELVARLTPTLFSAALMYAAVVATRAFLLDGVAEPWRLAALVAIGAATYAGATLAYNRGSINEAMSIIRA